MVKIIDTPDYQKFRNEIKRAGEQAREQKKPVVVLAKDDKFNRKALEYGKFDILLSVEKGNRKTTLKSIDSGLNHVLSKIARARGVSVGLDFGEIRKLDKARKADRLSKIMQNIAICRKNNTSLAISGKNKESLYLLLSLGASTKQAKKAIEKGF